MASSSGYPSSSFTADNLESLRCSVCLDVVSEPKFLPLCFHPFCKKCLDRLPAQGNSSQCPNCHGSAQVFACGVSAFQNDLPIDTEGLGKATAGAYCALHPGKEKDLFCADCRMLVCTTCLLTNHEGHMAEDIEQGKAKAQLLTDQCKLELLVDELKRAVKELKDDMKAVLETKETLEDIINVRHRALYKAADRLREEALDSLRSVVGSIRDRQTRNLQHQQRNVQKATELQQQLQQALDSGEGTRLLQTAREMRCGRGNEEILQLSKATQMTTVRRPVLRSSSTPDATLQSMKDFIGRAADREVPLTAETSLLKQLPDVTVRVWVHRREDKETEVCSLRPLSNGNLLVHYTPTLIGGEVLAKKYRPDGSTIHIKHCPEDSALVRTEKEMGTNSGAEPAGISMATNRKKFSQDTTRRFELSYEKKVFGKGGKAEITMFEVTTRHESKAKHQSYIHTFFCSRPEAFDVHVNGELIAVLETKEEESDSHRRVQLYTRARKVAIATYSSPVTPYRPSDVCFYTLGDQEVLLVADELNDAIHVVSFDNSCLTFLRYLSPGCPLLVQPTVLSPDLQGRLWVACSGGKILVCTLAV